MSWDLLDTVIVAFLFAAWWFMGWADERDLFAIALFRLRLRMSRHIPVGWHRVGEGATCRVGRPDTLMVFNIPLRFPGDERPTVYVGVTEESTRFTVGDQLVTLDGFLEAYDDEVGPIDVQVFEPGILAEMKMQVNQR